jgi:hypothetical protein
MRIMPPKLCVEGNISLKLDITGQTRECHFPVQCGGLHSTRPLLRNVAPRLGGNKDSVPDGTGGSAEGILRHARRLTARTAESNCAKAGRKGRRAGLSRRDGCTLHPIEAIALDGRVVHGRFDEMNVVAC